MNCTSKKLAESLTETCLTIPFAGMSEKEKIRHSASLQRGEAEFESFQFFKIVLNQKEGEEITCFHPNFIP